MAKSPQNPKQAAQKFHAWNPGLESEIPANLLPLVTLFRAENATVAYEQAKEEAAFCGLTPADLCALKPERLVVHELLIRITACYAIPDGPRYEDMGLNLRAMTDTLLRKYAGRHMDDLRAVHANVAHKVESWLKAELADGQTSPSNPRQEQKKAGFFSRLLGKTPQPLKASPAHLQDSDLHDINVWTTRAKKAADHFEATCLRALSKVASAVYSKHGRISAHKDMVLRLAARLATNELGSEAIGDAIYPIVLKGAEQEGYRPLPAQVEPVIMNVKGASAAGKSTIRPQQQLLAGKIDVPWQDFAVISPDYWRKFLLDYDTLGADYKYAAMLTGQELEIIDRKLDQFMARKAERNEISHLLIDRFRFDSFLLEHERAADSRLLTRFGDLIFMFFMITAPAATVERAWQRGLSTGRYKAVEDLLYHNVEAYTGMPDLFFSWILEQDKRLHFEFLDNNVKEGERPRTIAFGWNKRLVILDVEMMLEIERYKHCDPTAKRPEEVLPGVRTPHGLHTSFLSRCARLIPQIEFADRKTGHVYGAIKDGVWVWRDKGYFKTKQVSKLTREALSEIGWNDDTGAETAKPPALNLPAEKPYTLGAWG